LSLCPAVSLSRCPARFHRVCGHHATPHPSASLHGRFDRCIQLSSVQYSHGPRGARTHAPQPGPRARGGRRCSGMARWWCHPVAVTSSLAVPVHELERLEDHRRLHRRHGSELYFSGCCWGLCGWQRRQWWPTGRKMRWRARGSRVGGLLHAGRRPSTARGAGVHFLPEGDRDQTA